MLQTREQYERKLSEAAEAHRKALEASQRDTAAALDEARKEAAMRLAGASGAAQKEAADLKARWGAGGSPRGWVGGGGAQASISRAGVECAWSGP